MVISENEQYAIMGREKTKRRRGKTPKGTIRGYYVSRIIQP